MVTCWGDDSPFDIYGKARIVYREPPTSIILAYSADSMLDVSW